MPSRDGVGDHLRRVFPDRSGTFGDVLVAGDDAVAGYTVVFPCGAFGQTVEQHRLKTIDGGGKFRFRCRAGFEFVPERTQFARLIWRQQTEDALGGFGFALVLIGHAGGVVGEGVTGVDFDEIVNDEHFQDAEHVLIVNDEHFQDAEHVERLHVAVFGEDDHEQRQVPGMLGVVFAASALSHERLPEDFFQFIRLDDEADLLSQSFVCHCPAL